MLRLLGFTVRNKCDSSAKAGVRPLQPTEGWAPAFAGEQEDVTGDESGFTLVELMVVIVIIGLLATIVVINVLPSQDRAMAQKARSDVALMEQALEMYRLDNMAYPRSEQGLNALVSAPAGLAQAGRYRQGGYIRSLPNDPWGAPYEYANPGTHGGPFDIYSLGADGQTGGEGENADIGSWQR